MSACQCCFLVKALPSSWERRPPQNTFCVIMSHCSVIGTMTFRVRLGLAGPNTKLVAATARGQEWGMTSQVLK